MESNVVLVTSHCDTLSNRQKLVKLGAKTSQDVGWCSYRYDSGNNCAVGCLFSDAQLKWITKRGLDHKLIEDVARAASQKNIEMVTGLSLSDLLYIQSKHDELLGDYSISKAKMETSKALFVMYIESILEESK